MVCPTRLAEAQAFAEADLQQVLKNLNTNEKISLLAVGCTVHYQLRIACLPAFEVEGR